jgi:filamentous hemagglutinin family protein
MSKRNIQLESQSFIGLASIAIALPIPLWGNNAYAQSNIEADGSLGTESSQVIPNARIRNVPLPVELIRGGARRGSNLFHSFREFNVSEGRGAYFINPPGVENILSRVTGTNPSNILGVLGVGGNANLFLMNPNGIIFGQNAILDVKGSFVATTASSIDFAGGIKFGADASQTTPLLTVNVPVGLQFGTNPGKIIVRGKSNPSVSQAIDNIGDLLSNAFDRAQPFQTEIAIREAQSQITGILNSIESNPGLLMRPGKTLALVGGDVLLEGGLLTSPGGRIELGSVADRGTVSLTPRANGLKLGYEDVTRFGNIDLSDRSLLSTNSGDIQIRGDRVTFQDGSAIFAATLQNRTEGEILVEARQLNLSQRASIAAVAPTVGKSEDITVKAENLTLQDALVGSFAFGQADIGNIEVRVTDSVKLSRSRENARFPSGLFVLTAGTQVGGNLTVEARELIVRDGAQIAVSPGGTGKGGTAQIDVSESIELSGESANGLFPSGIFTSSFGLGEAGNLNIETQRLIARGGASVSAFTRNGLGGTVDIKASDFVVVTGTTASSQFPSDISANTLGDRAAGNVQIETGRLIVRDGGQVTAAALQESTGAAGNIEIEARSIYVDEQGKITTDTRSGEFGNIALKSQMLVLRRGGQITTNAEDIASGGNIEIDSQFLIAVPNENSDITANAIAGRGGEITIISQGIFGTQFREDQTPLSDITASSESGIAGVVAIEAPDLNPSRALVNLPTQPITTEVVQACTPSSNLAQSEFVMTGRGGLPPSPSEVLSNEIIEADWVSLDDRSTQAWETGNDSLLNSQADWESSNDQSLQEWEDRGDSLLNPTEEDKVRDRDRIIEAQGWVVGSDGKVVLTAQASMVTPYNSWSPSNSCQSF